MPVPKPGDTFVLAASPYGATYEFVRKIYPYRGERQALHYVLRSSSGNEFEILATDFEDNYVPAPPALAPSRPRFGGRSKKTRRSRRRRSKSLRRRVQ